MHLKFHRRRVFGLFFGKRDPNPQTVSGTIISDHDHDDDSTATISGILTGPVTITVTTMIPDPTSISASTTALSTSSSVFASSVLTTSASSTTSTTLPAMTTVLQTSNSLTTLFTTSSSSTAVVPPTPSASVSIRPIAGSSSETSKLPAGAIVGVVIALFLALVVSIIVVLRKRSVRNRVKLRGFWTGNGGAPSRDLGISSEKYPFPAESSPTVQPFINPNTSWDSGGRGGADILANKAPITQPRVPVPRFIATPPPIMPAALGLEERSRSPGSRRGSQLAPPNMPAAMEERSGPKRRSQLNIVTDSPPPLSPFGATVKYTFLTNLPDELQITVGERIRILAEYDDGWGLCINALGEQGVIPLECIDRGDGLSISPARLHASLSVKRRTQRMSSLPPPPGSPVAEPKPYRF